MKREIVPPGNEPPPPAAAEISPDKIEAVNALHKKFVSAMKKGAVFAFEIGKRLREIWGRQKARDSWPDWCRENLAFDVNTANRYLRIYENFKDNPKALAGLTTSGALKLLSAPQREPLRIEDYGDADRQPELPWERYFELPPLAHNVKLVSHRFEVPNSHEVYLIRRGLNFPVKIADILVPENKRLKTAHRGMLENVQAALERYYQEVERLEALEANK
ncbi:MAG: DUF3102 domain-containing protein [Treponema sp.]|jgi:hypothetical protein|nr:DUF3102 domain-containing protein [Treponema sp.]